ncbi:MAG: hypothetical protein ACSHWN_04555 [Methylophilaceae bacterium]
MENHDDEYEFETLQEIDAWSRKEPYNPRKDGNSKKLGIRNLLNKSKKVWLYLVSLTKDSLENDEPEDRIT